MVEVLREGTKPARKQYEATCRDCDTLFRFTRSEARFVADQRDGDAVVIACPTCGKECWVTA